MLRLALVVTLLSASTAFAQFDCQEKLRKTWPLFQYGTYKFYCEPTPEKTDGPRVTCRVRIIRRTGGFVQIGMAQDASGNARRASKTACDRALQSIPTIYGQARPWLTLRGDYTPPEPLCEATDPECKDAIILALEDALTACQEASALQAD